MYLLSVEPMISRLPGPPLIRDNLIFYGAIGAGVLVLLVLLVWLMRGRKRPVEPESGLGEDLAEYPPPPKPGPRRVSVQGQTGRIRLVVVAPLGKRTIAQGGAVEPILNQVLRGLGDVTGHDKPRVRVWPPQLSNQGFAPTFFRLVRRPEPAGRRSRWVLLAGPARAGGQQVLVGLAVLADEANDLGNVVMQPAEWQDVLRLETGA
jgi:hypothetical protein